MESNMKNILLQTMIQKLMVLQDVLENTKIFSY